MVVAQNGDATAGKSHETAPLLTRDPAESVKYSKSVTYLALLAGFMISMSFGVTQVPLIYVFRLMTCDAYYKNHPEPAPSLDRCGNHEIEAGTARAVSLLGASTTMFGVLNIFVTQWTMKKFGIKSALLISVFWPAVRLAVQNIGVQIGGSKGIIIVQSSQIITILGGPAGYLLALNSYVTEITEHSERTGVLGKLQGCSFLGTSLAYLLGGLVAGQLGIIWPFRVTLGLFLTSCFYVALFLPWLPLNKSDATQSTGISKFFGPLKSLTPQKWTLRSGKVQRQYGAILLATGAFLGVLATGYQSVLLQMYGTDVYHFETTQNGYLISLNIFVRGIFLMFAFPRIISAGRNWFSRNKESKISAGASPTQESVVTRSITQTSDSEVVAAMDEEAEEEPLQPAKLNNELETFDFDLQYTRYSLFIDGILTGSAIFITKGWQMYLISGVLPLAAGTGSSAKGVILQMCAPSERTDALSAITLVEMVARLATTSVFGLLFAVFAEMGQIRLIFICNAGVALLGYLVLMCSRFPPAGSKRFVEEQN